MNIAKNINDELMDCVDRLGSEHKNVSIRTWNHLLIYAPKKTKIEQQSTLMKFCPAYGTDSPYPSNADQYRKYHGEVAWLFNPWNGKQRSPMDIGSDVTGLMIIPDTENHIYIDPISQD